MNVKIRSPCGKIEVKRGLNKRERREKTLTGHKKQRWFREQNGIFQ